MIQIYGYSHTGSIPLVIKHWIDLLSTRYSLSVYNYHGKYGDIADCKICLYFGHPLNIVKYGNYVHKHKYKIGVFVSETNLGILQKEALESIRYNYICVPSSYCAKIFGSHSIVIPHGNSLPLSNIKKRDRFTYLFVMNDTPSGGVAKRKNLENLILASKKIGIDHDLVIKCQTSTMFDYDKYKDVKFIYDFLLEKDLADLYKSCHIYVNPSRAEGFGITVVESMCQGLPTVSATHTGLMDIIDPQINIPIRYKWPGEMYNNGPNLGPISNISSDDIASSMIEAYNRYKDISKIAENNINQYRERYKWSTVLTGLIQIIDMLENRS